MAQFHFIRPLWLLLYLPGIWLFWRLLSQRPLVDAWKLVCDEHLLPYLIQTHGKSSRVASLLMIFMGLFFMIVSLAGPTWSRLPVPVYQKIEPHVVVLDMSEEMFLKDSSLTRMDRAKFVLRDLFHARDAGQFAMVAYTGEPFVVSPLTDDGETIDALLSSLTPDVMPVQGQRLDLALLEAQRLITQAGFREGDILVLTAHAPSDDAIRVARTLAKSGIDTSVIPITMDNASLFQHLASAGGGQNIALSKVSLGIKQWLGKAPKDHVLETQEGHDVAVWKDEGRWFLIPSLLCLLPVFRRGWLQRINS